MFGELSSRNLLAEFAEQSFYNQKYDRLFGEGKIIQMAKLG
jgi:hypothetical protein